MIPNQIEPLSEQQLIALYGLQQSTLEAEEALSQGLDALNQSLSNVIVSDSLTSPANMANYMEQMGLAMGKLSTLEGFVRQVHPSLSCFLTSPLHQLLIDIRVCNVYIHICLHMHVLPSSVTGNTIANIHLFTIRCIHLCTSRV